MGPEVAPEPVEPQRAPRGGGAEYLEDLPAARRPARVAAALAPAMVTARAPRSSAVRLSPLSQASWNRAAAASANEDAASRSAHSPPSFSKA